MNKKDFIFNWILINKLAIGTSPSEEKNLEFLKKMKVESIIGLCSPEEINWHKNIYNSFKCERVILPDSNTGRLPSKNDLEIAYEKLKESLTNGITFVHCFASIERSSSSI